ncbi:S41 family peptidase [Paenibacillus xerothermodurans]|uniref:PDZ domain-containing protein n=1 Tax=Paenibacillus xerothermodurans TaxID=1977292 RepID=A0A2W1NN76_PAEXE|nr:S41 family peptidase [Paenibacillus xerothermodurans]PZE19266.1 PDZ domain-containing protein [Paenibacillus xerothermodurans]
MTFKGRTVLAFILLAMFASSIMTLTIVHPSIFAAVGEDSDAMASVKTGLGTKDLNKIATTYQLIEGKFLSEVDREKVVNGAINGMLATLEDPFTVYMDQNEAKQFDESITSSFQGIGAEVSLEDGKVTIMAPIKGSPAEKAGLHVNDVIVSVNGEKLDGLTLNQAIMKIRGPKGTQAKLEISRPGSPEPIQMIVVRDDIDVETVHAEMLPGNIGKIEIRQFASNTSKRFADELQALESKGMKGLIIDVRNDPGGLLSAVVEIAEPFVPKGKDIVKIEDRNGNQEATPSQGTGKNYPVTVLTNKGSASASEILAGALRDSAGSKVIGETTYGKGTVQITFEKEMGDGSNIKMTVYKWLTPSGEWIHKKGLAPDIPVEQPAYFKVAPLDKKQVLKPDTNNEDVKNLQIILSGLGLAPDRMDGYFSEKTALSVKAFQRMQGLPITGEVDADTASRLEKAILAEIKNPKNDLQLKAAVQHLQTALSN